MSAKDTAPNFDVLIVGAGISGIGMAAHMEMHCPGRSYAVVEARDRIGGTWDLFRYPGVRSDSDMHTLGYGFEPWVHEKSIADGDSILEYLKRIVAERDIERHIRFGHRVVSADWRSDAAHWRIVVATEAGEQALTARFLYLGSGYYDYDQPHDPGFDTSNFTGEVVHPQFWPDDLDYAGKEVVVIGSGATAVTIVPAMADTAARVTMLQRTPTWMVGLPSRDRLANLLRKVLPDETAYRITRWKNVLITDFAFKRARGKPEKFAKMLTKQLRKALPDDTDMAHFTPPYGPWDQRLCAVPDDDLFVALESGKARVMTDRIARFSANTIELESGDTIPADVVVTATGLTLVMTGKIAISMDGVPVDFAQHYYYKGCMFSNVSNFAVVFGYLNASWTLRADLNSDFICRVLNRMEESGDTVVVPVLTPEAEAKLEEDDIFDFSSGYIQRARHLMPKSAVGYPWRLNQDYRADRKHMAEDVNDGVLAFGGGSQTKRPVEGEAAMEPAE